MKSPVLYVIPASGANSVWYHDSGHASDRIAQGLTEQPRWSPAFSTSVRPVSTSGSHSRAPMVPWLLSTHQVLQGNKTKPTHWLLAQEGVLG